MYKWSPTVDVVERTVYQIVVSTGYCKHVLYLAKDCLWSGHFGISKTYARVLKHFWPALGKDVTKYCWLCHISKYVYKSTQIIPPAPLHPIPVIEKSFAHVLVDWVGPLPKSGNKYLLTLMCKATCFPEAIPLWSQCQLLSKLWSIFGLPRVHTDQGTNFRSKVFSHVLTSLKICHQISSPYHPESQGALEQFHQSLKSMFHKYFLDTEKDWDEGVTFVWCAVREAMQRS